ncbi:MAG: lipid-A-disaccharide synthase, partial [Verrucomicrobiales bacterium]
MDARCFLISGELSGDTHGAALMESLRDLNDGEIAFAGLGGPQMRAVGGEAMLDWIEEAAVVGLWEVLKNYGYFKRRFAETLGAVKVFAPDVVVLIDYPGFNLRMAKALREGGYAGKIAYYISPQVWAWNRKRIPVMAKLLDLMLCIFPFEKPLYEDSGLVTEFAGHPLVDELSQVSRVAREDDLLGLFPGSRSREVHRLFPMMLEAAVRLRNDRPNLRVATAAANASLAETMRAMAEMA